MQAHEPEPMKLGPAYRWATAPGLQTQAGSPPLGWTGLAAG